MAKQIIVTIGPDGATKVEASGAVGRECLGLTKPYEDALGRSTKSVKKPEFAQGERAALADVERA